jgi:2,5-diketo-D-gluconate reductase A
MAQARLEPAAALPGQVAMPMVGLGTWRLQGRRGAEAIGFALEVGYRHIDTATMYGNQVEVGRALRGSGLPRQEVFLTTKLPTGGAGRERQTLAASLRELATNYVDLWLMHWPPGGRARPQTWGELLAAREQGLVRAVGVSNYSLSQLDELIEATGQAPAVNQIRWGPSLHDPRLLAGHRQRGVVLEGYSPLKGARLGHPVLREIAAVHGVTPARVVLRWHVDHQIPVIPKSATRQRIAENLDLFGFSLTPQEVARIDALSNR